MGPITRRQAARIKRSPTPETRQVLSRKRRIINRSPASQTTKQPEPTSGRGETFAKLLADHCLRRHNIPSSGDCLFEAIVHQRRLLRDYNFFPSDYVDSALGLRQLIVTAARRRPDDIARCYGDLSVSDYADRMSKQGEWGGHLQLVVAAELLHLNIRIFDENHCCVTLINSEPTFPATINIAYIGGTHYESLVPGTSSHNITLSVPSTAKITEKSSKQDVKAFLERFASEHNSHCEIPLQPPKHLLSLRVESLSTCFDPSLPVEDAKALYSLLHPPLESLPYDFVPGRILKQAQQQLLPILETIGPRKRHFNHHDIVSIFRARLQFQKGVVNCDVLKAHMDPEVEEIRSQDCDILADDNEIPNPPSINDTITYCDLCNSNFPSDGAKIWVMATYTVLSFASRVVHAAELQFQTELWHRLLKCILAKNVQIEMEFPLQKVLPKFPVEEYSDHAAYLHIDDEHRDIDGFRLPFLLGETSAFEVLQTDDHKDFRKMTDGMAAILFALMGVVKLRDDRHKLRVFGCYFGGAQFHMCYMKIAMDEDNIGTSFVFHADPGWRMSFIEGSLPAAGSDPDDVELNPVIMPEGSDLDEVSDYYMKLAKTRREKVPLHVRNRNLDHNFAGQDIMVIQHRLRPFIRFCFKVVKYAAAYKELLKKCYRDEPDTSRLNPFPLTAFGTPAKSRTTHFTDTPLPEKRKLTLDQRGGQSHDTMIEYLGDTVIKTKLRSGTYEGKLLERAQGPGIVRLFEYCQVHGRIILVEQALVRPKFASLSVNDLARCAIQLLFHGAQALSTLRKASIVHGDISPNNIMYSEVERCWKLTDFNAAVELEPGQQSFIRSEVVGTDGFIAPETLSGREYSFNSDWYSFGKTASHILNQIEECHRLDRTPCGHEFSNFILQLQMHAELICCREAVNRPMSSELIDSLAECLMSCESNPFV